MKSPRAFSRACHVGLMLLVFVSLGASQRGLAQEPKKPKPVYVYLTSKDVVVRNDQGESLPRGSLSGFFWLKNKEGDKVWIVGVTGDHPSGWVRPEDVVDIDEADAYFSRKIEASPDAYAYYMRANASKKGSTGLLYPESKRLAEKLVDIDAAIRLDPTVPEYFNDRSMFRISKGDFDGSIADCTEALRLCPVGSSLRPSTFSWRALGHREKGELTKALVDLDEAIRIDPSSSRASINHMLKGDIFAQKGEYDEAIREYSELIPRYPQTGGYPLKRGIAYLLKGQPREALADLDTAVKLMPKDRLPLSWRGRAKAALKDYAHALQDFDGALKLDTINPVDQRISLINLAHFRATCPDAKFRDGKAAVDLAQQALNSRLRPSADVHDTLASALAETGEFDRAVETQEGAIKLLSPESGRIAEFRAHLDLYRAKKPLRDPAEAK